MRQVKKGWQSMPHVEQSALKATRGLPVPIRKQEVQAVALAIKAGLGQCRIQCGVKAPTTINGLPSCQVSSKQLFTACSTSLPPGLPAGARMHDATSACAAMGGLRMLRSNDHPSSCRPPPARRHTAQTTLR